MKNLTTLFWAVIAIVLMVITYVIAGKIQTFLGDGF